MKTFLVTGGTRGLGLGIARALASDSSNHIVITARDHARGVEVARSVGPNVEARALDLASLDEVRAFAESWTTPLAGLANNAGVQIVDRTRRTRDGLEETIAVNHLAATLLTAKLLPLLVGGRVLFIGSGTIDPGNGLASRLGFRGARFTSIAELARGAGEPGATEAQLGRDRYATSKLLDMATAIELARRIPSSQTAFFTLDPGLMAGTGLARTAPLFVRVVWSTLLRWLRPLMPGASTPALSGAAAAHILSAPGLEAKSGEVFGPNGHRSARLWEPGTAPDLTARVLDETYAFLGLAAPAKPGGTSTRTSLTSE